MPLSALITPATLTVVPSVKITPQAMHVPMVDYGNISALYTFNQNSQSLGVYTADNGITPSFNRLMAQTASGHGILPMVAFVSGSATYALNFSAPSMQCVAAPPNVTAQIQKIYRGTGSLSNGTLSSPIISLHGQYIAFTPQVDMLMPYSIRPEYTDYDYTDFVNSCILPSGSVDKAAGGTYLNCDGMTDFISTDEFKKGGLPPRVSFATADVWVYVKGSDNYWNCSVRDTQFGITFNITGNVQTIDQSYTFKYTGQSLNNSHYVYGQIMSDWLTGAVIGWAGQLVSYRTSITRTSLYGSLRTYSGPLDDPAEGYISDSAIPDHDRALTRGLNMGQLIEELSRNLTLSYFSADQLHLPGGIEAVVDIETRPNIYHYNVANLAWAYGVAIAVTFMSAIIGIKAMLANGVSHETSFSSILCSTRNPTLDRLSVGSSLAATPLAKTVRKTELRFGLLQDRTNEPELIKRVAFGVDEEIDTLQKGTVCY